MEFQCGSFTVCLRISPPKTYQKLVFDLRVPLRVARQLYVRALRARQRPATKHTGMLWRVIPQSYVCNPLLSIQDAYLNCLVT